jgi:hypothetical protein
VPPKPEPLVPTLVPKPTATEMPEAPPVESMRGVEASGERRLELLGVPRLFQCFPSPAGLATTADVDQSMRTGGPGAPRAPCPRQPMTKTAERDRKVDFILG